MKPRNASAPSASARFSFIATNSAWWWSRESGANSSLRFIGGRAPRW